MSTVDQKYPSKRNLTNTLQLFWLIVLIFNLNCEMMSLLQIEGDRTCPYFTKYPNVTLKNEAESFFTAMAHIISSSDPAKLIFSFFHPLKVVFRYHDPQLQLGDNYSYHTGLSLI